MIHIIDEGGPRVDLDPRGDLIASSHSGGDELARVPKIHANIQAESRLVVFSDPYSMEADKFRTLRVYLRSLAKTSGIQTLMITSARMGEGKSVTSLNLAASLAERGESRVILVETDLRSPTVAKRLGLESWPGLSQCLLDGLDPLSCIRYVTELGLYVLIAGETCSHPLQLLNSDRFSAVMQRLRHVSDWVILDSPPVIPVPDVLAIRANVDGCFWVVRANLTSRTMVDDAMQKVGRERILGIILNEAKAVEDVYRPYYSYEPLMLGPGS